MANLPTMFIYFNIYTVYTVSSSWPAHYPSVLLSHGVSCLSESWHWAFLSMFQTKTERPNDSSETREDLLNVNCHLLTRTTHTHTRKDKFTAWLTTRCTTRCIVTQLVNLTLTAWQVKCDMWWMDRVEEVTLSPHVSCLYLNSHLYNKGKHTPTNL